ncbi:AAA family ATPase [Sulfolobus sp. B1]|nr:AAA family ATPase [Sulfolobus sp. B1]
MRLDVTKLSILLVIIFLVGLIIIYRALYLIVVLLMILLIIQFHDRIFYVFKGYVSQTSSYYVIDNGVFYDDKKANAVLIIDDILTNYRDYNDVYLKSQIVSFYKILDIAKDVTILLRKEHIDKNNYLESLSQRAQSLRIVIENDPSNEKAKRKLELIQNIISRVEKEEIPFKYELYVIINAKNKSEALALANTIKQGLEGLGIKSRFASINEIKGLTKNFFDKKILSTKVALPLQLPYITPFSIEKQPKHVLMNHGVLLGKDLDNNSLILWNLTESENTHILVTGPTGSGKTEFLIRLSTLLNIIYDRTIILFDIKGDIKYRLLKYRVPINIINPLMYKLGLLYEGVIPITARLLQIERILYNSFRLTKLQSSVIYTYLNRLLENRLLRYRLRWKDLEKYFNEIDDIQLRYYISKIVNILSALDDLDLIPLVNSINEKEINVVDLTTIKNEEIRRLIIYTFLYEIYNKISLDNVFDIPKVFIVLDEAWTILKAENEDYPIVADLIKRGRGHGISIIMATQNIEDLGELANIYLDNVGLALFMK